MWGNGKDIQERGKGGELMAGPGETRYPDAKKVTARTQVRDVRTGEIFLGFVDAGLMLVFPGLLLFRPL